MTDRSNVDRLNEINQTVNAATKLAEDPDAFLRALEAFRAENAEAFQSELSRVDLLAVLGAGSGRRAVTAS